MGSRSLKKELSINEPIWPVPMVAFYGRDPKQEFERERMLKMAKKYFAVDYDQRRTFNNVILFDGNPAPETIFSDRHKRATDINPNVAPFEHMVYYNLLARDLKDDEDGFTEARYNAGLELRSLYDGAQVSTIKGPTTELVDGGGGGSAGRLSIHHGIDCRRKLERVRAQISSEEYFVLSHKNTIYDLLMSMLIDDKWVWLNLKPRKSEVVKERLRLGLDAAAIALNFMRSNSFEKRWPTLDFSLRPKRKRVRQSKT